MLKQLSFNLVIGLIFLCTFQMGFSQSEDYPMPLTLGLSVSPDYAFRSLEPDNRLFSATAVRDSLDKPIFGYTLGISMAIPVHPKWMLETGLFRTKQGFNLQGNSLVLNRSTRIELFYNELWIRSSFYPVKEKVNVFFSLGFSIGRLNKKEEYTTVNLLNGNTETMMTDDLNNLKEWKASLFSGIGIDIPLNQSVIISMFPNFNHDIVPMADTSLKYYLYNVGCMFTARIILK